MKHLYTRLLASVALVLALTVALAPLAEARPGGGRSSGFRGSRNFGTRTAPSAPYNNRGQQQNSNGFSQQPGQPAGGVAPAGSGMMSGGFMRGVMGGLAGGMIGSMLFGGLGHAGGFGGGGTGFLDILLLAGLGFMVFRFFQSRRQAPAGANRNMSHYSLARSLEARDAQASTTQGFGPRVSEEESCAMTLARYDSAFDLGNFKDGRVDDFMKLQAAWNHRDLAVVSSLVAPELRSQLDSDIAELKARRQVNRIENIAVRGSELIEAWAEKGQEFATLRFRANLTDYTVDESSGEVVAGDRVQPVKFEEDWTFVRPIGGPVSSDSWKITAIEA